MYHRWLGIKQHVASRSPFTMTCGLSYKFSSQISSTYAAAPSATSTNFGLMRQHNREGKTWYLGLDQVTVRVKVRVRVEIKSGVTLTAEQF